MSDVQETFGRLTGALDYPMLIATTAADGERAGCLVGFATQCSIDPQRFPACLSNKNRTFRVASHSDALAVHFVAAGADELVDLFGSRTGDDIDKFARCEWHPGPLGLPILDACRRWVAGRILDRLGLRDHVGLLLDPFAVQQRHGGSDFPFHRAKRPEPGHEA